MSFVIRKLNDTQTFGAALKELRLLAHRTVSEVADQCKVRKKFIDAFENDRFDLLPEPLYARNFLRAYVQALGGDQEYFVERFDAERGTCDFTHAARLPVRRKRAMEFFVASRYVKAAGFALLGLALVFYIGGQLRAIITAPKLTVAEPTDGLSTGNATVHVAGTAENETSVRVNGNTVLLDQNGWFETDVALERGLNVITIEGSKRYSRSAVEYRRVVLEQDRALSSTASPHTP